MCRGYWWRGRDAGVITDVEGVSVGHWSDEAAGTGCTVVLLPEGTVASGEIGGGAPGTREWGLLAPERLVSRLDAVVLAGGSAFGLAACDGVMRWCEERGTGLETPGARVPIVVGAVLYDLSRQDPSVRPGAEEGYAACAAASSGEVAVGRVGAGTGATAAKCRGSAAARPAGLGTATLEEGALVVSALVAVNAYGDLLRADVQAPNPGDLLAEGLSCKDDRGEASGGPSAAEAPLRSTTIGVVATNATLDKIGCLLLARSAHDGLARCLEPVHTRFDGDAMVGAATGRTQAPLELVRLLGARAVDAAVRSVLS